MPPALLDNEQLEFVDIATTVASHKALVELAARAEVAVICQKPCARSLDDAPVAMARYGMTQRRAQEVLHSRGMCWTL